MSRAAQAQTREERAPSSLFVDGERRAAADGRTYPVINPATGEGLAEAAWAGVADVDAAVASARAAFRSEAWAGMDAADRGALLWRVADSIAAHADELTRLEVLNTGKPIREARIDLSETVDTFRYYAGWATKLYGQTIPVRGPFLNYTLRQPAGVIGAIIPWNFPLLQAAWKIAPALACANTVVLKPAEQTPLSALELAALALEAGLPRGVMNVVTGDGETTGAALVRHGDVDRIAFTGSTAVGKTVMREAAATLKPVSLELGGKSPNIVFEDADLDDAARGSFHAIFYNAGQCCTAGSRLLVHESVKEELVRRIVERARKLVPADPFQDSTRIGPLISEAQLERVLGYVARGRAEGARIITGGTRATYQGTLRGYWMEPTIFDAVQPDQTIARDEIFGPVLAILTFRTEEEAVDLANNTIYGLAAGLWTRDVTRAHRVARQLEAGTVWINLYNNLDAASPFGGMKQSGFGRELGASSLDFYTQEKSVWVKLQ